MKSLQDIQKELKISNGDFNQEIEEQSIIYKFLSGNEKVLELGSNIGRSSLIVAYILKDNNNFVTIEPNKKIAEILKNNRDINGFNFNIETAAISNRQLIQKQDGIVDIHKSACDRTFPSDHIYDNHQIAETISLSDFKKKYPIDFDTLIVDCEGAFYHILKETPEILNGIQTIIIENDYETIEEKIFVDSVLIKYGFNVVYRQSAMFGVDRDNFYQVWQLPLT